MSDEKLVKTLELTQKQCDVIAQALHDAIDGWLNTIDEVDADEAEELRATIDVACELLNGIEFPDDGE